MPRVLRPSSANFVRSVSPAPKNARPSISRSTAIGILQRAEADPQSLTPADVHILQRTIGNRATGRILSQQIPIQRQLKLGPADDAYEREADAVARQVVGRMAAPRVANEAEAGEKAQAKPLVTYANLTDRPAAVKRTFDPSMIQRDVMEEKLAQATAQHGLEGGDVDAGVAQSIQRARGSGQPLDERVRRRMEQGFGASFGGVRVHTDTQADTLNRSLNARAFTSGNDIFFGKGEYNPGSRSGQELLAHELTHTVQQGGASVQRTSDDPSRPQINGQLPSNRISTKKKAMHLDFVKMLREDPDFGRIIQKKLGMNTKSQGGGTYGHWWTEVGDARESGFVPRESYGWWPAADAPSGKKLWGGVPGALNGEGPASRRDPHQGDEAPTEFHPTMNVDLEKESYDEIKTRVTDEIRDFAQSYNGKWSWKLGWGKNCHTFQQKLKKKVGLHNQKSKHWLVNPNIQEAVEDRDRAAGEVKATFVVPEGRTLARHSPDDGSDIPGGGYRGGTEVGATGKVIEVAGLYGRRETLVEYIVDGTRNWISQVYWEMWFGENSYPADASAETVAGTEG